MEQQRVPQRKIDAGGEHHYKHGCPAGLNFFESHAPFEDFIRYEVVLSRVYLSGTEYYIDATYSQPCSI